MQRNKPIRKLLSLTLLLAMIFMIGPLNTFAAETTPQRVNEISSLRTENSRTYLLDNGQYQVDVYASDIYYRDSSDSLREISNKLVVADSESGYKYTNEANSWRSSFKDDLSSKDAVSISQGNYSISFSILGTEAKTVAALSDTLKSSESELDRAFAEDNRVIMYKGVFPSTDIAYTTFNSCLKEDIILRDITAPSEFTFDVTLKGLTLSEDNDGVCFIDNQDDVVFRTMPLFMEDAKGKRSESVKYNIVKTFEGYRITISADEAFLNDPSTVFPVVIDPSYATKGSSNTADTFVSSGRSTENFQVSNYLRVGNCPQADAGKPVFGVCRSYVRFKLPSGYQGISSVQLKLWRAGTLHGSDVCQIYLCDSGYQYSNDYDHYWKSGTLTYGSQPMTSGWEFVQNSAVSSGTLVFSANTYVPGDPFSPNISKHLDKIYTSNRLNLGFILKSADESDPDKWEAFYSSDYSNTAYIPVITVTADYLHSYDFVSGIWAGDLSTHLSVHIDTSTVPSTYISSIESACTMWNGINADVHINNPPVKSAGNGGSSYDIRFVGVSNMDPLILAQTANYTNFNKTGGPNWTGIWVLSEIEVPIETWHVPYGFDTDILKSIFTHEIGHSLGLLDLFDTTCLMNGRSNYMFPMVNSHDKSTLNYKYN
jgi:hypothetical protein